MISSDIEVTYTFRKQERQLNEGKDNICAYSTRISIPWLRRSIYTSFIVHTYTPIIPISCMKGRQYNISNYEVFDQDLENQ